MMSSRRSQDGLTGGFLLEGSSNTADAASSSSTTDSFTTPHCFCLSNSDSLKFVAVEGNLAYLT